MKKITNAIMFLFILLTCLTLSGKTYIAAHALDTKTDSPPSVGYTIVVDPGHGGVDVK